MTDIYTIAMEMQRTIDEQVARIEVLEEALSKISELQFSDADDPLDDAIAFARDALNGNKP